MRSAAFWLFIAMWTPIDCDRLVLKNGTVIPLIDGFRVKGRNLHFQVPEGHRYSVGWAQVNWKKTFARPRPKRTLPILEDSVQREIPWEHPHYRDKKTKLKDIVITGEDIARFAAGRQPGRVNEKPEPEKDPPR